MCKENLMFVEVLTLIVTQRQTRHLQQSLRRSTKQGINYSQPFSRSFPTTTDVSVEKGTLCILRPSHIRILTQTDIKLMLTKQ